MWRGFYRNPYRHWRHEMRHEMRWARHHGPLGWGYGWRRGPSCCLFFALPLFILPLCGVAALVLHVL